MTEKKYLSTRQKELITKRDLGTKYTEMEGSQREGAEQYAKSLTGLKDEFEGDAYERVKGVLKAAYNQFSGDTSMDREIMQVAKILKILGVRDSYGEEAWHDLKVEMNERSWSKNYRRFNFFILKDLARELGDPWPRSLKVPEQPQDHEMTKPVMPSNVLKRAIKLARNVDMTGNKNNVYEPKAVFCLAVSSTYGIRKVEIARLRNDSIDRENHIIEIETAKKGEYRKHNIPEPIRPYLYDFDVDIGYGRSRAAMSEIFHSIFDQLSSDIRGSGRAEAGKDPWGWHSIRRRLVTDYENMRKETEDEDGRVKRERRFSRSEMINFFRWAEADPTMLSTYARKDERVQELDNQYVDKKFFDYHPYLDCWRS